jgi:iron(III) transport system substrate-binding protein
VLRKAPNARAARLFYEYLISDEGQKLLAERDYIPASRTTASPLKDAKVHIIDPAVALDQSEKWAKVFSDTFISRRQ